MGELQLGEEKLNSPFTQKINQKRPNLGWPVEVVKTKRYCVSVEDISHDLFGDDSYLCLQVDTKVYKKKILGSGKNIEFKNLKFSKGRYDINVYVEGTKKKKEWRYHVEDDGHRRIRIY